ncbi:TATA-binding protein interacting (TIP20) [Chlamydia trachomatis]|nr:TATA-binding protein interacting (TIP20) [Chlamydia trachomatis]
MHSKPDTILPILDLIILPKIFDQLQAEDSFKKIITMGPYKYVLDEGLEIRKLCYEFIYSVISLENAVIKKYNINLEKIASKIIEVGLIDTQTDITVLACINLTNYIELHKDSAVELITRDGGNAFTTMINNLKKQLSKKLSAKASTQDSESHQERIKSIIKLSKKFASVVEAAESIELAAAIRVWNEYNNDLKTNFTIYYNSTDGV